MVLSFFNRFLSATTTLASEMAARSGGLEMYERLLAGDEKAPNAAGEEVPLKAFRPGVRAFGCLVMVEAASKELPQRPSQKRSGCGAQVNDEVQNSRMARDVGVTRRKASAGNDVMPNAWAAPGAIPLAAAVGGVFPKLKVTCHECNAKSPERIL